MKKAKRVNEAHSANTKYGSGDFYGTGVKNPVGRVRESYMNPSPTTNKSFGTPPKKLA